MSPVDTSSAQIRADHTPFGGCVLLHFRLQDVSGQIITWVSLDPGENGPPENCPTLALYALGLRNRSFFAKTAARGPRADFPITVLIGVVLWLIGPSVAATGAIAHAAAARATFVFFGRRFRRASGRIRRPARGSAARGFAAGSRSLLLQGRTRRDASRVRPAALPFANSVNASRCVRSRSSRPTNRKQARRSVSDPPVLSPALKSVEGLDLPRAGGICGRRPGTRPWQRRSVHAGWEAAHVVV